MRLSGLRAQVGGTTVSALALTLLVLGCVFVAVAGPRYSLHSRTRALQHELAGIAPVDTAVQVTDDWYTFANQVTNNIPPNLDDSQLSESRTQIAQFLTATPLPLGAGRWAGLSTNPLTVTAGAAPSARSGGVPPELEVIYRDTLTSNVTLVSGSFPPPSSLGKTLHIAVTTATAARFGLRPGSVLKLAVDRMNVPAIVTAIVRPRMLTSAFWNVDTAAQAPSFNIPGPIENAVDAVVRNFDGRILHIKCVPVANPEIKLPVLGRNTEGGSGGICYRNRDSRQTLSRGEEDENSNNTELKPWTDQVHATLF